MNYFDLTEEIYDLDIFQQKITKLVQVEETRIFSCSYQRNCFKVSVDDGIYSFRFPKHFDEELKCIYLKSVIEIIDWNIAPKKIIKDKFLTTISLLR